MDAHTFPLSGLPFDREGIESAMILQATHIAPITKPLHTVNGESFTGLNFCGFHGFSGKYKSFSYKSFSISITYIVPWPCTAKVLLQKSTYCGYRESLAL